jgi:hypothetical protein
MWVLNAKEMKSSSKIDLRDVSWWKSTKDACRLEVLENAKLSKEGCISLIARGKPFCAAYKHD